MATMLDCKKIQPLLSEYVDGALDGDAAWGVKMHVASCAVCSRVADELSATAGLLRSLPTAEPTAAFEEMLARRLADRVLTPRKPTPMERAREWWQGGTPRLRPLAASAAALAALAPMAATVFVLRSAPETQRSAAARPATPAPSGSPAAAAGEQTLNQFWSDHLSYASTEPLGNGGGGILPNTSPASPTDVGL